MERQGMRAFPLTDKHQITTLLGIACVCLAFFLICVFGYRLAKGLDELSISGMCNNMVLSGQGRLFFVLMSMAGVTSLLSWFECHLGDLSRKRRTPQLNVFFHVLVCMSMWGVGQLPYDVFGEAMNRFHDVCAMCVFGLHPVLELLRLIPTPPNTNSSNKAVNMVRISLSASALVLLVAAMTCFRLKSAAGFWLEYALACCLVLELFVCWLFVIGRRSENGEGEPLVN